VIPDIEGCWVGTVLDWLNHLAASHDERSTVLLVGFLLALGGALQQMKERRPARGPEAEAARSRLVIGGTIAVSVVMFAGVVAIAPLRGEQVTLAAVFIVGTLFVVADMMVIGLIILLTPRGQGPRGRD
jgi:hypothetical protein